MPVQPRFIKSRRVVPWIDEHGKDTTKILDVYLPESSNQEGTIPGIIINIIAGFTKTGDHEKMRGWKKRYNVFHIQSGFVLRRALPTKKAAIDLIMAISEDKASVEFLAKIKQNPGKRPKTSDAPESLIRLLTQ